jgi:hypothetical protein
MKTIKNQFSRFIFIAAYILILIYSPSGYAGYDDNVLFVKVPHENGLLSVGTAFIVNMRGEKYIVTSYHVVEDAINMSNGLPNITFTNLEGTHVAFDKYSGNSSVSGMCKGQDLAFFHIPSRSISLDRGVQLDTSFPNIEYPGRSFHNTLSLDFKSAIEAFIVSYTHTETNITRLDHNNVNIKGKKQGGRLQFKTKKTITVTTEPTSILNITNCKLVKSNSGSPVFYYDKVIGIVASSEYELSGKYEAFAIHSIEILECLNKFHRDLYPSSDEISKSSSSSTDTTITNTLSQQPPMQRGITLTKETKENESTENNKDIVNHDLNQKQHKEEKDEL